MRLANTIAFFFALTSAFLLYSLNYETRRLEADVQALDQRANKARSDIAILKAEKSHLGRPERIAPLARAQGLISPRPDQMSLASALPDDAVADAASDAASPVAGE
ncbi:MAG: cell division protein FtsL [Hyphomicrobium sp.]